ncbi:MAG: hypothetical protein QOE75_1039 [Solirubrobacterales bacterium]|jgi:hypothetical protein|nr:hypothetical protein [Solirubrobacterales bacterium]
MATALVAFLALAAPAAANNGSHGAILILKDGRAWFAKVELDD